MMEASVDNIIALAEHSLTGLMAFTMLILTNRRLDALSTAINDLKTEIRLMREGTRR